MVQAEGTARAKTLGKDRTWCVGGTARRPVCVWSRVSEGERGRRGEQGGDLGFYPQGGGSPGGLWAEEGVGSGSGAHRHLQLAVGRTDSGG